MFKKIISLLLSIILLCSVSTVAYAQSPDTIQQFEMVQLNADVMPCFEYTDSTITSLSISTSGKATCSTSITGYSGTTTKIVIKMKLQKRSVLWWSTKETWEATVNSWNADLTKTASVESGKYRVKVECTVYSGSNSEEITTYSQEKEY